MDFLFDIDWGESGFEKAGEAVAVKLRLPQLLIVSTMRMSLKLLHPFAHYVVVASKGLSCTVAMIYVEYWRRESSLLAWLRVSRVDCAS
ncbi:MAG: hypothetical protein V4719_07230 [Planctomycetota bacterium]